MPRTRAYRRHKRHVKLARRYRLLAYWPERAGDPRAMNDHLRCNCFDDPRASALTRRREARVWRALELRAW